MKKDAILECFHMESGGAIRRLLLRQSMHLTVPARLRNLQTILGILPYLLYSEDLFKNPYHFYFLEDASDEYW